jgi:hypothetical protein
VEITGCGEAASLKLSNHSRELIASKLRSLLLLVTGFLPDRLITEGRRYTALFKELISAGYPGKTDTSSGRSRRMHAKRCAELFRQNCERIDGVCDFAQPRR